MHPCTLIREDTGLHAWCEHALGVPGVVRKKFNGSKIVGKSHPPSVLCLDGTTTPGPYLNLFEPGNELLAPRTSRNMFCI